MTEFCAVYAVGRAWVQLQSHGAAGDGCICIRYKAGLARLSVKHLGLGLGGLDRVFASSGSIDSSPTKGLTPRPKVGAGTP